MTTWTTHIAAGILLVLASGASQAQSAVPATRGQLLYDTHCVACHDKQVHWRDAKLVTSWSTLVVQVRRWQDVAKLLWTEDDILQVARHLNSTIYRYRTGALAHRE